MVSSLQQSGLVDKEMTNIIPDKSFTFLSLLLAAIVGLLYRYNSINVEIELGRISFWFVTNWTIILLCIIIAVNYYVLLNFVLDTIVLSYRMASFFKRKGILSLIIFHIDGCGGFAPIGSLAMKISSLAVLAGIWAVWYSLLPKLFGTAPNLGISVWLIYAAYIILAPVLLLLITWPVHKAMRKYKMEYKQRVCDNLETTFNTLSSAIINAPYKNLTALTENLEQYKCLMQVLERVDAIPEWPILLANFKKFTGFASLPGIIGFVSFLFDLIDFTKIIR